MRFFNYLLTGGALLLSGCQLAPSENWPVEEVTSEPQAAIAEPEVQPVAVTSSITIEQPDLWHRLQQGMHWAAPNEKYVAPYRRKLLANPRHLQQIFSRAEPFLYLIVDELDKRSLPLELALLPAIESSFDPQALSHANAAGLWQLTPPMARYFGLKMNWWYDGRNDVVASTRAAVDFLEYLYQRTGQNWHYAIAAYNSGEGRVNSAVKHNRQHGKPTDIWALKLPKETRNYVPNLLAMADVVKHAKRYGVKLPSIRNEPMVDIIDTGSQIELALVANLAGLSVSELKALNPGFKQWATAPKGPHRMVLPVGKAEDFVVALSQVPANERVSWQKYPIQRGDSLSVIARRYGTTPQVLKQVNGLNTNRLIAGKELIVPASAQASSTAVAKRQDKHIYRVKNGDNLWKIAQANGVTVEELTRWNRLDSMTVIKKGQVLTVWPGNGLSSKGTYEVKQGDSLSRIADKFKVKVSELMSWNKLSNSAIRAGQTLTVMPQ